MEFTMARAVQGAGLAIGGLALVLTVAGYGGTGSSRAAPAGGPLTISSPAFSNGAPIPVQYTCKGANVAPALTWSAPLGAALVVDDPDAVNGVYVHWIVTGIPFGSGSTADGQTPGGGTTLPNTSGHAAYQGPCPPAGTGTHHYRFTLYQLPNDYQLPGGLAGGQAAQTIAGAATARAQLTGTFGG
jgi:Raf kinase inhibitor-like YbhB/YbcL family protein